MTEPAFPDFSTASCAFAASSNGNCKAISSVMLLLFRPYKVGDFIDAAGRFGNVTEIDMFTTILQTFDNQQIIIPNSQ
ncbi:MAG: mechanosensitive ion channel domain-containing protein, partial [Candidatus Puniceispirillales bacterium]